MKRFYFILFLIVSAQAPAAAEVLQPDDSAVNVCQFIRRDSVLSLCSRKGYIPSLINNFGEQFISPFRMKAKDWAWTLGVASATAILFHFDYDIDERVRHTKEKSGFVREVSPVVTEFGNTYGISLVGVCGIIGLAGKNQKLFQTSLMASQAAITSGIWVRIVKYCTSRERPNASYTYWAQKGHQGGYWYGFFKQYDQSLTSPGRDITFFDAFPSGHTSTAFAIATVFAMQYDDNAVIPVAAYSLAGLVGITRMIEHTHWSSDVFVGAWAGYLCAKQVVHHQKKVFGSGRNLSSMRRSKPDFFLSTADGFTGLKLKMIF